jgi:hypothetical protein
VWTRCLRILYFVLRTSYIRVRCNLYLHVGERQQGPFFYTDVVVVDSGDRGKLQEEQLSKMLRVKCERGSSFLASCSNNKGTADIEAGGYDGRRRGD